MLCGLSGGWLRGWLNGVIRFFLQRTRLGDGGGIFLGRNGCATKNDGQHKGELHTQGKHTLHRLCRLGRVGTIW